MVIFVSIEMLPFQKSCLNVKLFDINRYSWIASHTLENHFEFGADCLFMFKYDICNINFSLSNSCLVTSGCKFMESYQLYMFCFFWLLWLCICAVLLIFFLITWIVGFYLMLQIFNVAPAVLYFEIGIFVFHFQDLHMIRSSCLHTETSTLLRFLLLQVQN